MAPTALLQCVTALSGVWEIFFVQNFSVENQNPISLRTQLQIKNINNSDIFFCIFFKGSLHFKLTNLVDLSRENQSKIYKAAKNRQQGK